MKSRLSRGRGRRGKGANHSSNQTSQCSNPFFRIFNSEEVIVINWYTFNSINFILKKDLIKFRDVPGVRFENEGLDMDADVIGVV